MRRDFLPVGDYAFPPDAQLDYRLDVSEGFQLFKTLQRRGVPSNMLYFPDEGHWVLKPRNSQLWYKTLNDWVVQWIGK